MPSYNEPGSNQSTNGTYQIAHSAPKTTSSRIFFDAVGSGQFQKVKDMIAKDKDVVNERISNGKTPLNWLANLKTTGFTLGNGSLIPLTNSNADSSVDCEMAALLIEAGADLNTTDNSGRTPLINAITSDKVNLAKFLINKACNVNQAIANGDYQGSAPLHAAVGHGEVEVIKMLFSKGAKINSQTKDGSTPLHIAAMCDSEASATLLMQLGADPSIKNQKGQTPSDVAVAAGYTKIAEIISQKNNTK